MRAHGEAGVERMTVEGQEARLVARSCSRLGSTSSYSSFNGHHLPLFSSSCSISAMDQNGSSSNAVASSSALPSAAPSPLPPTAKQLDIEAKDRSLADLMLMLDDYEPLVRILCSLRPATVCSRAHA